MFILWSWATYNFIDFDNLCMYITYYIYLYKLKSFLYSKYHRIFNEIVNATKAIICNVFYTFLYYFHNLSLCTFFKDKIGI